VSVCGQGSHCTADSICLSVVRSRCRVPVGRHERIVAKWRLDCAASSVRRHTVGSGHPFLLSVCTHSTTALIRTLVIRIGLALPANISYCNCATSVCGLNISPSCQIHISNYVLMFYLFVNIFIYLFTTIGLLPGGSGYFTCKQSMK